MTDEGEILDLTKLSPQYRMGVVEAVREAAAEDFEVGDRLVFRKNEDGGVVLEVA